MSGVEPLGDDVAVAVSTRLAPLVSLVVLIEVASAAVVVVVAVVACRTVNEAVCGAILFASGLMVIVSLGDVAILAVRAAVLEAVITVFTAAIFTQRVFSRHFFLLPRLPCPGPGMLSVEQREAEGN